MSLTHETAVDEMLSMFKTAWDTTGFPAHYEEIRSDRSDTSLPWATTRIRHVTSHQSSLNGNIGQRRFTHLGYFTVQIFVPSGKGLQEAYRLAKVVSDAFEGVSSPSGIWFRNVTPREVDRDGAFFQQNVIIEFNYDEVR